MIPEDEEALARLREKILDVAGERIARIIAYGSRVLGTARPDSDLDVMILLFGEEIEADVRTEIHGAVHPIAPYAVNAWIRSRSTSRRVRT